MLRTVFFLTLILHELNDVSALAIFDLIAETDDLIESAESLYGSLDSDCKSGFVSDTLNGFTYNCDPFNVQLEALEESGGDTTDALSSLLLDFMEWNDDKDEYSEDEQKEIAMAAYGYSFGPSVSDGDYVFEDDSETTNELGCYWQRVTTETTNGDMLVTTYVVRRVDPECISDLLDSVVGLQSIWEYQINSTCAAETNDLAQTTAVTDSYSEETVYSNHIYINHGTTALFYDYDESTHDDYESACEDASGVYRQLDIIATCTETSDTTDEVLSIDYMYINNLPRCYGETCTTDQDGVNPYDTDWPICYPDYDDDDCSALDDTGLLVALTMDLTEELNSVDGSTWTCSGSLYDDADMRDEWCERESSALAQSTILTESYASISSTIVKSSDMWSWFTYKMVVQFTNVTDYEEACETNGATLYNDTMKITCTEKIKQQNYVSDLMLLEVLSYPSCLSVNCDYNETDRISLFEEYFVDAGYMRNSDGYDVECTIDW